MGSLADRIGTSHERAIRASLTVRTPQEWASMSREEFYAVALHDSGSVELAEFATKRLYDLGFLRRFAAS